MERGAGGRMETLQRDGILNDTVDLDDLTLRVEAEQYSALGRERHAQGDVEDAAAYYQMSLDLFPTAEAHTYLAWALASRSRWEEAISECKKAIQLNPNLGNPYNDIGVYLERLGRVEEALGWFERALRAPDYDCRHYPYYHIGRIFEQMARFGDARNAYLDSLELSPSWETARFALRRVLGFLN